MYKYCTWLDQYTGFQIQITYVEYCRSLPDDDVHLNGWFSDYILIREGSTVFNVSDLDLKSRVLIEPCAVLVHAVERAKTTGILDSTAELLFRDVDRSD